MKKKRNKKFFKYIFRFLFLVLVVDALLVFGIPHLKKDFEKADAAVILGAAINSPALYNRSLQGLSLYHDGKVGTLILSGGRISNKDVSEAGYMQKTILNNSSRPPKLLLDEEATNTKENILNAKKLAPDVKSLVVVSDEFHLARGVLLAKRFGFETVYWSAPDPSFYRFNELAFYYIRELAAMIYYVPTFILGR